jgi:hypothetical protein
MHSEPQTRFRMTTSTGYLRHKANLGNSGDGYLFWVGASIAHAAIQELKYIHRHGSYSKHISQRIKDEIEIARLTYHVGSNVHLCARGVSFLKTHYDDVSPRKQRRDAMLRRVA